MVLWSPKLTPSPGSGYFWKAKKTIRALGYKYGAFFATPSQLARPAQFLQSSSALSLVPSFCPALHFPISYILGLITAQQGSNSTSYRISHKWSAYSPNCALGSQILNHEQHRRLLLLQARVSYSVCVSSTAQWYREVPPPRKAVGRVR